MIKKILIPSVLLLATNTSWAYDSQHYQTEFETLSIKEMDETKGKVGPLIPIIGAGVTGSALGIMGAYATAPNNKPSMATIVSSGASGFVGGVATPLMGGGMLGLLAGGSLGVSAQGAVYSMLNKSDKCVVIPGYCDSNSNK